MNKKPKRPLVPSRWRKPALALVAFVVVHLFCPLIVELIKAMLSL